MNEELPRGWYWTTLEKVCEPNAPIIYGILQPGPELKSGVPYVRPTEIRGGKIQLDEVRRTSPEIAARYARASLREGDVLLSIVGTIGKVAVVPRELNGANITQSSVRIRPGSVTGSQFLRLLLKAPVLTAQFDKHRLGTGVPRLNVAHVRELRCPLPPLNEQRRIVAKLEALQARSRRARDALDAVPQLLEKLRQSILAAAFQGDLTKDWRAKHKDVEPASELLKRIRTERRKKWEEAELAKMKARGKTPTDDNWKAKYKEPEAVDATGLPELPQGWCWAASEEVVEPGAEIVYGIVQPGPVVPGGVPYVRGMDIQDGVILEAQLLRTSREIAQRYERASLQGGDVLLGIIRATKVAIVPDNLLGANITQGTARFRPSSCITTEYLAGWLDTLFAQSWLRAHYRGIDMPGLNLQDVRRLPVALAPRSEQTVVVDSLRAKLDRFRYVREAQGQAAGLCAALERAILAKAFRGELVQQDPNDEPADVMLTRLAHRSGGVSNGVPGTRDKKVQIAGSKPSPMTDSSPPEGPRS